MYGPSPPPVDILEEDYNILLSAGIDTGIEDIDMLEQCYEKDATSIAPKYILKVSVLYANIIFWLCMVMFLNSHLLNMFHMCFLGWC